MSALGPAVTIECGKAGDPAADAVALAGLKKYLGDDNLPDALPQDSVEVLGEAVRVFVHPKTRLSYAETHSLASDVTLQHDIDRHNFKVVPAGTGLGWLGPSASWPFRAINGAGEEVSRSYFEIVGGTLLTTQDLTPIMITTSPEAALGDCLFYLVKKQ
jgi:hypothetical protein